MTATMQELIDKCKPFEISEALLPAVKEIIEYESLCGKVCSESDSSLTSPKILINYKLNLFNQTIDTLAVEQDRGRQALIFQEDTALINLIRRKSIKQKNFKTAIETIRKEFDDRGSSAEDVWVHIPRCAVKSVVEDCGGWIDPVNQRELIVAGYVGIVTNMLLCTTAHTLSFELLAPNEIFGIDKSKCKMDIVSDYHCVGTTRGCLTDYSWDATIQLELLDESAIIWVELDKD